MPGQEPAFGGTEVFKPLPGALENPPKYHSFYLPALRVGPKHKAKGIL